MTDEQVALKWASSFANGDIQAAAAILASDATIHDVPASERLIGPRAFIEYASAWTEAFDVEVSTTAVEREAPGLIRLELSAKLRHVRPFHSRWGDVAPTGKDCFLSVEHRCRIAQDHIAEVSASYDLASLLDCIGLRLPGTRV